MRDSCLCFLNNIFYTREIFILFLTAVRIMSSRGTKHVSFFVPRRNEGKSSAYVRMSGCMRVYMGGGACMRAVAACLRACVPAHLCKK